MPAGQTQRTTVSGSSTAHVSSVLADLNGPLSLGHGRWLHRDGQLGQRQGHHGHAGPGAGGRRRRRTSRQCASFTNQCTALACSFDATGSSDSDGNVTGYAWNFGDTATSTLATPSHTYANPGSYSVTLTVTDDQGGVDTLTRQITVTAVASNVAYVGSASATANAAKVSVTVPTAVTTGNGLVLIATSANGTTSMTAPAGWTLVDSAANAQVQTAVWQRVAVAGSAGSSVQVTLGQQAKVSLMVAAYSGTNATSPIAEHAVALETASAAGHVTPTVATSSTGAWLLSYWSDISTDNTGFAAPAGQATRSTAIGAGGGHVTSLLVDLGGPLSVGTVGGYTATGTVASAKAVMTTLVLASS